jgi:hypothetical protein
MNLSQLCQLVWLVRQDKFDCSLNVIMCTKHFKADAKQNDLKKLTTDRLTNTCKSRGGWDLINRLTCNPATFLCLSQARL